MSELRAKAFAGGWGTAVRRAAGRLAAHVTSVDDDLVAGGTLENVTIANAGDGMKQEVGIKLISGLWKKRLWVVHTGMDGWTDR